MNIFSEESAVRIRSTVANLMNKVDLAIPVDDDYTVHIKSERDTPVNRAWKLRVQVTTTVVPEDVDENPLAYLHEVNDKGVEFVEEWEQVVEGFDWLDGFEWNFLLNSVYDCGGDLRMATYSERVNVNAEDVLSSLVTDKRVVRLTYDVPREVYAVLDADVNLDDAAEVTTALREEIPCLGWNGLPVVDLEPEVMEPSLNPHTKDTVPSVKLDEVKQFDAEFVDPTEDDTDD